MKLQQMAIAGQYEDALSALTAMTRGDVSDRGYLLGHCLTFLGRTEEALAAYQRMREWELSRGVDSVGQSLYSGIACWYSRRKSKAVAFWREGINSGRSCRGGYDTEFLLYFAAASGSAEISLDEAVELIQRRTARPPGRRRYAIIGKLLTREFHASEFTQAWEKETAGCIVEETKRLYQMLTTYYLGLRGLADGDLQKWKQAIRSIVSTKKVDDIDPEWMVATLEMKRLKLKV